MKWAVTAFELALFVYWAIILWTQIAAPLYKGTKLFPYFRNNDLLVEGVNLMTELEREVEADRIHELRKTLREHKAPAANEGEKHEG